jgi:tetratricopeptide (TPR) repeat protein
MNRLAVRRSEPLRSLMVGHSTRSAPRRSGSEFRRTMKTILGTSFIVITAAAMVMAADSTSPDLREYVCTNRYFAVPEAFDISNVEKCRLLIKANPNRFESHLMLASAFVHAGRLEDAIEEFRTVDELSSKVKDREVLASLPYEGYYAFALAAAADKRYKQDVNDLYTLRMLQQVIGMDLSDLREKKRLAQCYMMLGSLYLKRGLYDQAIEVATTGIKTAQVENHADFVPVFEEIMTKAKQFKNHKPRQ